MTSPVYQKKIDAQVSTPGKARWIYYTELKRGMQKQQLSSELSILNNEDLPYFL